MSWDLFWPILIGCWLVGYALDASVFRVAAFAVGLLTLLRAFGVVS